MFVERSPVALGAALDLLCDAARRPAFTPPLFDKLRNVVARTSAKIAQLDDQDGLLAAAVRDAAMVIASFDKPDIRANGAVTGTLRAMARLQRITRETVRARRRAALLLAEPEVASAVPPSTDLRQSIPGIAAWDFIGPSAFDAIIACVHDARRRSQRSPNAGISRLSIQYGERIIAGTAPASALPSCDPAAVPPAGIGLPDEDRDQSSSPAATTLSQLKASLVRGQPFAFLFLQGPAGRQAVRIREAASAERTDDRARAHAATAIGYDDSQQAFLVVEQGDEEGAGRHATVLLSYAYVTHPVLSQDVWTIR